MRFAMYAEQRNFEVAALRHAPQTLFRDEGTVRDRNQSLALVAEVANDFGEVSTQERLAAAEGNVMQPGVALDLFHQADEVRPREHATPAFDCRVHHGKNRYVSPPLTPVVVTMHAGVITGLGDLYYQLLDFAPRSSCHAARPLRLSGYLPTLNCSARSGIMIPFSTITFKAAFCISGLSACLL